MPVTMEPPTMMTTVGIPYDTTIYTFPPQATTTVQWLTTPPSGAQIRSKRQINMMILIFIAIVVIIIININNNIIIIITIMYVYY